MKEYTLLTILSVIITLTFDWKFETGLLRTARYYALLLLMFAFMLCVNGYLTCANIVRYDPGFFSGVRLGCIPVEDFLFGFSMVTQTLIFWEYFKWGNP